MEIKDALKTIFKNIFYFGFHPRQSLFMFYKYIVEMFWYLFLPAVLGLFYLIFKDKSTFKKIWPYMLSGFVFSLILILYYGSWNFVDNPDPNRFTIGNSYTRYWLPIYAIIIPLASLFILNFSSSFFRIRSNIISVGLLLLVALCSLNFLYQGSEEGLKYYWPNMKIAQAEFEQVILLTEDNSIIITEYHDKFFFPERRVIVGRFNDDRMNNGYHDLLDFYPVYYYNFTLPSEDIEYLNNRRLYEFGLNIELVQDINNNFSLYKILKVTDYEL